MARHLTNTAWGAIAGAVSGLGAAVAVAFMGAVGVGIRDADILSGLATGSIVVFFGSLVGSVVGAVVGAMAGCLLSVTGSQRFARPVGTMLGLGMAVAIGSVMLIENFTYLNLVGGLFLLLALPAIGFVGGMFFHQTSTPAPQVTTSSAV